LGGTSIRAASITASSGAIGASIVSDSSGVRGAPHPAAALADLLRKAASAIALDAPAKVVVAVPGPVGNGQVRQLPTLFERLAVPLDIAALAQRLWPAASVWVCNDLTAAGYGMVAAGERDFFITTCGSGIGAKLFLDGRPMLGPAGMGGEIGHWSVPGGADLPCDCGGQGHLGAIASGRGVERLLRLRAQCDAVGFAGSLLARSPITTRSIAAAFRDGDRWTTQALAEPAAALGNTLALVHLATGVARFILFGGFVTALGPAYVEYIAAAAAAATWDTGIDWRKALSLLGQDDRLALYGGVEIIRREPPLRQVEPV